jgi:hypothetical protein
MEQELYGVSKSESSSDEDEEELEDSGVLSDVHVNPKRPEAVDADRYITRFKINFPKPQKQSKDPKDEECNKTLQFDKEGDLIVPRRRRVHGYYESSSDEGKSLYSNSPLQLSG